LLRATVASPHFRPDPVTAPRGPGRSRLLAAAILEEQRDGTDADPERLPTERELAVAHGVTRAAVREALAILAAEGRISREVGRGTFMLREVGAPGRGSDDAGVGAGNISPADVLAVRRLIEPEILRLVVVRATERDLVQIDRCLAGGATATTTEDFEHWDLAFHHAIAVASHNPLLVRIYGSIETARRGEIWGNLKRRGDSAERRAARHAEHVRIAEALRAREVVASKSAMDDHLKRVAATMLGEGASLGLALTRS
jgi:GntR family transcriptional regulator, uxu operon transcriptional repressor